MRRDTGKVIRLRDYRPSDYHIASTRLTFRLHPRRTLVTAELDIVRREGVNPQAPLVLDGDELELAGLALDGRPLDEDGFEAGPSSLLVRPAGRRRFTLTIKTLLAPERNRALMGLFLSNGTYCTQCEAEGFRAITYFLDRPDVLSVYTVRIEADRASAPLLLSNGNPVEQGLMDGGLHYAVWHDPFPKPSYLFALVAGDLASLRQDFVTRSGRRVALAIHVEHGKQARAAYAMDALVRAMRWDEERFGREYDLDVFNIVAVADFNMGAMENKGLNIFNDKYVLADPDTATDADYANIEAIIAHEYFHNWTGNRITCRDWFQLCLKEGLTVFRDHEFSADQRSRAVKRIAEIRNLRTHQLPEDQGPLAHPVRPRHYREINNFYTATVYEKGSEVVRMIRTILGADAFQRGLAFYFERHDGEAVTIEDFLQAFADASGKDLEQFALWYHQAGTPHVAVSTDYDPGASSFTIELEQSLPATPGERRKRLMHIPLAYGLIGPDGREPIPDAIVGADVADGVIHMRKRRHTITFKGIRSRPVLSINRGFSAPVILTGAPSPGDRLFLARHDTDLFARWQAFHDLLAGELVTASGETRGGRAGSFDEALIALAGDIAADEALEPAYRALALSLPGESDIARQMATNIDPDAIFAARESLVRAIARANEERFAALYADLADPGPFSPDAVSAGRRALRNVMLDYLAAIAPTPERAAHQFQRATNMTDRSAALSVLVLRHHGHESEQTALGAFAERYRGDPLVLDKWFQIQAAAPGEQTLAHVRALMDDPGFSMDNPNRVRALIGTFSSANQTAFHRSDGCGYRFLAECVLRLDASNPQLAARLASALRSWRTLEPVRRTHARAALAGLSEAGDLSTDLADLVERMLA